MGRATRYMSLDVLARVRDVVEPPTSQSPPEVMTPNAISA
jgi:hypothetical protein